MTIEQTTNRYEGPCRVCSDAANLWHGGKEYVVLVVLPVELVLCTDCFEKLRKAMNAHRQTEPLRRNYSCSE
jgi:hypothetical protein